MDTDMNGKKSKDRLQMFNPIGLIAGILMILLPFLGVWWEAVLGENVLRVAFSPFKYELVLAGETLTSPLVGYFLLAAKLAVLIGGVFMIIGSIGASRWWGRKLVDWGIMRVFWMVILLIVVLFIGTIILNNYLPSLIPGMGGGEETIQLEVPYLIGEGHATVSPEGNITVSGPVSVGFTSTFWLAVITAGLGIGARFYQKRVVGEESEESEQEENIEKENN